uniref:Uncharacterized protein n=1 Tax=Glossina palpalis gambiensis TaxID=67801 RepID=A0A1B0BXK5_9MUSC
MVLKKLMVFAHNSVEKLTQDLDDCDRVGVAVAVVVDYTVVVVVDKRSRRHSVGPHTLPTMEVETIVVAVEFDLGHLAIDADFENSVVQMAAAVGWNSAELDKCRMQWHNSLAVVVAAQGEQMCTVPECRMLVSHLHLNPQSRFDVYDGDVLLLPLLREIFLLPELLIFRRRLSTTSVKSVPPASPPPIVVWQGERLLRYTCEICRDISLNVRCDRLRLLYSSELSNTGEFFECILANGNSTSFSLRNAPPFDIISTILPAIFMAPRPMFSVKSCTEFYIFCKNFKIPVENGHYSRLQSTIKYTAASAKKQNVNWLKGLNNITNVIQNILKLNVVEKEFPFGKML